MASSWFNLGALSGGSLYIYSGLGEFKSHTEAAAFFQKQPRIDRDPVIVETIPLTKGRIEWGYGRIVRGLYDSTSAQEGLGKGSAFPAGSRQAA